MKKLSMIFAAVLALCFLFTGCSNTPAGNKNTSSPESTPQETENSEPSIDSDESKTLVVYYSYSGNTKGVAELIRQKTQADIYEIAVAESYPENTHDASDRAAQERESGNLPELSGELPDLSDYTTVYIGGPVWTYTVSTPIMSYLEKTDFEGKTVIPFWTDAGTPGSYETDFAAQVKNGTVSKGLGITNVASISSEELNDMLNAWITGDESSDNPVQSETTNITLTSGDIVITATLDNSETTKAFLATLPRTLTMNNYADREYYARIDALPENGETISDYEDGDVTYYPAGPSFAVFFAKADSSNQSGLIRMGKVTSDLSDFAAFSETAEILIEVAE